jgi:hypothetical protein
MRWTVVICALTLAACNVSSSSNGGTSNAGDHGLVPDGGTAADAAPSGGDDGGDRVDCHAIWRQIGDDVEKAALALRGCQRDVACTIFHWSTECLTGCGTPVGVNETADLETAVADISAKRCTDEIMDACGIASASCEWRDPKCLDGQCASVPHDWTADAGVADAAGSDVGPCDPDLYCAQAEVRLARRDDGALVRIRDGNGQYNPARTSCDLCYQICSDEDKKDIFETQIRETYRADVPAHPCGGETDYCSGFPYMDLY